MYYFFVSLLFIIISVLKLGPAALSLQNMSVQILSNGQYPVLMKLKTNTGIVHDYLFMSDLCVFLQSALGSMMSIYSEAGDFDSVEVSGEVIFSVSYDEHTQSLHIFIKECHGLAYGDASRHLTNP